jgi:hypothetical protein
MCAKYCEARAQSCRCEVCDAMRCARAGSSLRCTGYIRAVRGLFAIQCAKNKVFIKPLALARAGCSCMRRYRRGELVTVACADTSTMLLTEGFLGWLSRFKLIRLRRISLATLPRYGRRGGCLYMYCLPPAGVLHSQNKVINAPHTASQS